MLDVFSYHAQNYADIMGWSLDIAPPLISALLLLKINVMVKFPANVVKYPLIHTPLTLALLLLNVTLQYSSNLMPQPKK